MYRRKVIVTAAAIFAIVAAFAAQPISVHEDWRTADVRQRTPWIPGTNMLMSAHEFSAVPLVPPPR
jgi:hypothetical protein